MWWSDASMDTFTHRTHCIAKQYSAYSQQGVPIDGNITLVENMADIEGLKIAFKAWTSLDKTLLWHKHMLTSIFICL